MIASATKVSNGSTHVHVTLSSAESTSSFKSDASPSVPAVHLFTRQAQADQVAQFFGASPKSRVPSYPTDGKSQRMCGTNAEPVTLARFMFVYGFVFPPFWLMGIIILSSELRPTPDWEAGKTEGEKIRLLAEMRTAEVKWAKRCIYALLTLITVIATIILAVVFGR